MRALAILAADSTVTQFRWRSLPALWLIVLVILPLVIGGVWWIYRREAGTASGYVKRVMGGLRVLTIVALLVMIFEPYAETSLQKTVRANLVLLLDTSASLSFADHYADEDLARGLRRIADIPADRRLEETSRMDLVRGVLGNASVGVLDAMREKFVLHVYTFDQELRPLWSPGSGSDQDAEPDNSLDERIASLTPDGRLSRIGDALDALLEEFRLRDEPLAGIVLVSDGRRHGGKVEPVTAARKAAGMRRAVPIHTVIVGDPEEARNVHVTDLRAKEVVLARDLVTFEFTVRATGYEGRVVPVQVMEVTGPDRPGVTLAGAEVVLPADGEEAIARISHRFERAGSFMLRIGVPTQPGEKVTNDNVLTHPLRVIDRRIKVLYVEDVARWEYRALMQSLIRDVETFEAQILLLDCSPGYVQFSTPRVPPIARFPHSRSELMEYDVIIFGDVNWRDLSPDPESARQDLDNVRAFVEAGGGFLMISGKYHAPISYRGTPLQAVLPVVIDIEEESRIRQDPERSTNMRVTALGRVHPIMQLEDDPRSSVQRWEEDEFSAFFWYYPVARAKEIAQVLAVHPGEENRSRAGPHPIFALMRYVRGKVFWTAIDELWRIRWVYEDHYYRRFWGEVIRDLATYKLQVGNRRFKIFTEDEYLVGDRITIRASVLDGDFNPSRDETQMVTMRTPQGREIEVELRAEPDQPGQYSRVVRAMTEGTYILSAEDPGLGGERPEKAFRVLYATGEMKDPLPDPQCLASIAEVSGGSTIHLTGLADLVSAMPSRTLRVPTDIQPDDLWDTTWVMLLLAALLTAEWILRKRYRLL